jgi:hypothetical protein
VRRPLPERARTRALQRPHGEGRPLSPPPARRAAGRAIEVGAGNGLNFPHSGGRLRFWFGIARYKLRGRLGRTVVPGGFDDRQDPPGTDYTRAAGTASADLVEA